MICDGSTPDADSADSCFPLFLKCVREPLSDANSFAETLVDELGLRSTQSHPHRSGDDRAQVITNKASPKVPIGTFDIPSGSSRRAPADPLRGCPGAGSPQGADATSATGGLTPPLACRPQAHQNWAI